MIKRLGLILGPLLFLIAYSAPTPLISDPAWRVIGLAAWMIVWWVSEALPIGITSLLPISVLSLSGVTTLKEACASYSEPIIFLFLGGFIIALSLEKWDVHRRVALAILSKTGTSANGVILGFMLATALLSMWMSNTATTLMMLPIALSVLELLTRPLSSTGGSTGDSTGQKRAIDQVGVSRFGIGLMLGVAYGANIGGTMTLIGTPPNIKLAEEINRGFDPASAPLTFLGWLKVGVPFGIVALGVTFALLVWVLYPNRLGQIEGAREVIDEARGSLGAWTTAQKRVCLIFLLTALSWVFGSQLASLYSEVATWVAQLIGGDETQAIKVQKPSDIIIALIGATALFMTPSGEETSHESTDEETKRDETPLLNWGDMRRLPWDIVLLFGGGLSLASALDRVGLIQAIGEPFANLESFSALTVGVLTLIALLLTEVMSNVALVIVLLPVMSGVARAVGLDPLALCAPVTLAASCAFMLPMSTPPNAIVFASGHVKISHMVKAGLLLNLVVVVWITALVRWVYF